MIAHAACKNTVARRGRASALNMAENRGTAVNAGLFLNTLRHFGNSADSPGNHYDKMNLSAPLCAHHSLNDITLKIILIKQIADGISNVKPLDIFIQYAQITSKIPAINKNNQAIFVVLITDVYFLLFIAKRFCVFFLRNQRQHKSIRLP